jgi:DNA-binding winged helix-turn-helix (wHTH) protein/Tol biopolymer transport system component
LATPSSAPSAARFDLFSVDLSSGELLRSGVRVPIQGQPFQVLRLLLEAHGKVVTREELRQALWPGDTFVDFELGVNTAVKKLRQALEDSAEHPNFIETLPKYGYRFMVPVQWLDSNTGNSTVPVAGPSATPEPQLGPQPSPTARRWKLEVAVVFAALAVLASFVSLSNEKSYLSRTLGMLIRSVLRSRADQPNLTERRLTANPDDAPITSSVISPDGKYLAYTDRTGFYLRQVSSGETHLVPLPKGFEPLAESWFPDSVHLIVSWLEDMNKAPSLWEVSVMGGTPRKLADDGFSARVSPDGSKIAFLRGRIESGEIWLMQADGSHPQRLTGGTEPQGQDGFGPVAWAPEGERIAYVRRTARYFRRDETKVEIADVATREIRVVLSRPGLGRVLGWPHDKQLIYSLEDPEPNQNDFNLWSVDLGPRAAAAPGSGTRITSDRGEVAELSSTTDGRVLAVRRLIPQRDVYVAELRDGGQRLSSPERLTLDERQDYPYSWTPDSKTVIFTSDRDGPFHIFKQSIDQTQPELMVGGSYDLAIPRLSPDNTELLYLVVPKRVELSQTVRIMRVPLSGGTPQVVLEGPWIWNQQCARLPSTLCIYTPSEPNQQRFVGFDPMTGASAEISAAKIAGMTGEVFVSWSLSPDGKYLATAARGRNKQPNIRIFSIGDNTEKVVLVPGWGEIGGVDWAADGKSLWVGASRNVVNPRRSDAWALVRVYLNGTIETVSENGPVKFWAGVPSPDSHRLAFFSATTDPSNVWLLENF